MFKRKQRQPIPTTPPNFLDLRSPTLRQAAAPQSPRIFSDIRVPRAARQYDLSKVLPARIGTVAAVGLALTAVLVLTHDRPPDSF